MKSQITIAHSDTDLRPVQENSPPKDDAKVLVDGKGFKDAVEGSRMTSKDYTATGG